ncbi:MAG: M24 family metallopeptidase [Anaeromyxobacteraceae bacterium]
MDATRLRALQAMITELGLDGWLLYDFRGQNPTAVEAAGLAGHMLTRRWFLLLPAQGEPVALVHAIERGSFPAHVPGERRSYASWQSLREELARLVSGRRKLAMEYFPEAAIPYLSRVDAGTLELVRSLGVEVASSGELVQRFLARWSPHQLAQHVRALRAIDDAKDEAFEQIGFALARGIEVTEVAIQQFLWKRFQDEKLTADHPPIVAVNGHAGDPHYVPSDRTPTPIRKGDLVLIDLWAKGLAPEDPYADITWCAWAGDRPSAKAEEIFRVAAEGRDAGVALLHEAWKEQRTLQGWELDRAVRDHIASRGYGEKFIHRTGHSIGTTNVHGDGANVDDYETHDTRGLVEGLAFSIEPGIYLPDEGLGVRTEIDVVMTPDGPQVFSKTQRELVRIAV